MQNRLPLALLLAGASTFGMADGTAKAISGPGTYAFLGLGLVSPLLRDGGFHTDHFWRTSGALATSLALTEGLKLVIHAPRPDGSGNDSFPSGHTALAFTVATMAARYHPREAPLWYAGAAIIGYSRIKLRKHNLIDVLSGAALGFATGRLQFSIKS